MGGGEPTWILLQGKFKTTTKCEAKDPDCGHNTGKRSSRPDLSNTRVCSQLIRNGHILCTLKTTFHICGYFVAYEHKLKSVIFIYGTHLARHLGDLFRVT